MKPLHFYLLLLLFSVIIVSCRDKIIIITPPAQPPTEVPAKAGVTVNVFHELAPGTPVENAEVFIGTHSDTSVLIYNTSRIPSKTTGRDGKVRFENLEPGDYFIYGKYTYKQVVHSNFETDFYDVRELKDGENIQEIILTRP